MVQWLRELKEEAPWYFWLLFGCSFSFNFFPDFDILILLSYVSMLLCIIFLKYFCILQDRKIYTINIFSLMYAYFVMYNSHSFFDITDNLYFTSYILNAVVFSFVATFIIYYDKSVDCFLYIKVIFSSLCMLLAMSFTFFCLFQMSNIVYALIINDIKKNI